MDGAVGIFISQGMNMGSGEGDEEGWGDIRATGVRLGVGKARAGCLEAGHTGGYSTREVHRAGGHRRRTSGRRGKQEKDSNDEQGMLEHTHKEKTGRDGQETRRRNLGAAQRNVGDHPRGCGAAIPTGYQKPKGCRAAKHYFSQSRATRLQAALKSAAAALAS